MYSKTYNEYLEFLLLRFKIIFSFFAFFKQIQEAFQHSSTHKLKYNPSFAKNHFTIKLNFSKLGFGPLTVNKSSDQHQLLRNFGGAITLQRGLRSAILWRILLSLKRLQVKFSVVAKSSIAYVTTFFYSVLAHPRALLSKMCFYMNLKLVSDLVLCFSAWFYFSSAELNK